MSETTCSQCGAPLENEEEICSNCEATVDSVRSPTKAAPPPPRVATTPPPQAVEPTPAAARIVADIMIRKVATLFEGEPLEEAEKGFKKVRFRHVPAVGADGHFIGLLSLRHLLRVLPSPFDPDAEARRSAILSQHRVGDIMARNVKTVQASTPLETAARLMLDEKQDCLPVIDDENKLIGVVTLSDFVQLALHLLASQP